ncbi:MAG: tetratricopeptide repeat protein [Polyangiaceae bacterium]|jgi:TolA-binding protein
MLHETDEELREIKREIIESRGLVIKTNNLTNALSADIKSIAKRQQSYERKLSWNSATAYVVFVFVVFAALKLAWDARVDQVRAETDTRGQENDRLRKEVRDAQKREEDRLRAEAKAAQYYELVRQNKRSELVEAFESIKKEPLSRAELAMFTDAADRAKNELSAQVYGQAMEKLRAKRWQEAASLFEESLRLKDDSSITPSVKLGLAQSYRGLGRHKDAIPILTQLADNTVDREVCDDALYFLAMSQTDLEAWNDAKNTWRTMLRRFPDSRYAAEGRIYLKSLEILH